jgi:site-specific DNA recombinase
MLILPHLFEILNRFLNHKTENNPESRFFLGMQGLVTEYEGTKIMERSRRGKLQRARDGCVSVITVAPYGYNRIKHVGRDQIKIAINEEEAKIVRQMFIWIGQERISIREVIRRLRDRSIRTRSGKKVWRPVVIWKMLRNPAYKGQAAFGKLKRVEKRGKKGFQSVVPKKMVGFIYQYQR